MGAGADEQWMRRAIEVATSKGSDPSTSPLGCVIVLDGKVIAAERNQTHELLDATAHAEMMAIRRACESTGQMELRGATLYWSARLQSDYPLAQANEAQVAIHASVAGLDLSLLRTSPHGARRK